MDLTAKFLCANISGAKLAYVASDEISILITDIEKLNTQLYFDGNIQKIVSISASMASGFFNSIPTGFFGSKPYEHVTKYSNMDVNDWLMVADTELGFFDSRIFSLPEKSEVVNYFKWRIADWERNSLQMLAQSYYAHSELEGKNASELHDLIHKAGDNWAKLDDSIKRGRICDTHLGDMWGIYPAPDLRDEAQKKQFNLLIPEHGYEL
jgi:tRNA(His) 5'-end guanylyltransferase